MNTLLSLLALSCLCGLSTALFGKRFFSGLSTVTKRDCQWMAWGPVGSCKKHGNTLRAEKKRERVPARNGGDDCEGSDIEYVGCTDLQYVATTFLNALTTQSRAKAASGGGITQNQVTPDMLTSNRPTTMQGSSCETNFTDAAGNVRMVGNSCQSNRRRRSANGNIKVDEGPLMERIRIKRQTPEPTRHRDMLFLLDESGSVGTSNFKKVVRLARSIIGTLCGSIGIGKDKTRIGVMGFDTTQHPMLDFGELFKQAQVLDHMDTKVTYTSSTEGGTCLNNALEYARTKMFHKDRGARLNSGVEQTIVLITDGCANCVDQGSLPTTLSDMRLRLEDDEISIIVYFIGELGSCKDSITSLLSGGQCFEVFTATTWAELDDMSLMIADKERKCTDSWQIPGDEAPSCA